MPEDEAFWALAQETDTPVAVHIGSFLPTTGAGGGGPTNMNTPQFMGAAGATKSGSHTLPVVSQLLFSGVFEKFTDVKLLLVESNIGWIPTMLEQIDDMFFRYRFFTNGDEHARHAEPHLPPELLGDVHDRHRRHGPPSPAEHRPDHVVDRLPAHRLRLAEQPRHDRAQLPRPAERGGEEDAARQLQTSVQARHVPDTVSYL